MTEEGKEGEEEEYEEQEQLEECKKLEREKWSDGVWGRTIYWKKVI